MKFLKRFDVRLILVSSLFLLVAFVAVTTVIIDQYQNALLAQNEQQTVSAFEQAETKIDRVLHNARKNATLILSQDKVSGLLYKSFDKPSERIVSLREVMDLITETISYGSELNGVWFFHEDGTMVGATETWHFAFEKTPHPIFEMAELDMLAKWDSVTWLGGWWLEDITRYPPRDGNPNASKLPDDVMILGVLRSRYRLHQSEESHTIYTLFSIGAQPLTECFETLGREGEEVYLLDPEGRQLLGPVLENLKNVPWFWSSLDQSRHPGSLTLDHEGNEYQLVYHQLSSTGWTLVKKIPVELYSRQINHLRLLTWGLGACILMVALLLYSLWVIRFVRPFKEMSTALEQVRRGDLSVQLSRSSGIYEFELMRAEFNSMIQSIQRLLSQTKEMEHERIELELRSLQSQLNPHMVFNSISAIRWMAMMSGAGKVGDMLVELAELIRPIFTEWRLVWSLRDEITYISHYLKLLTLRYGGLIHADLYIEEELMDVPLPCFTLQPLLENSAEHGVMDGKPLSIVVEGKRLADGRVQLCVSDNGRGIPEGKLTAIRQKLGASDVRPEEGVGHTGIGLINSCRRLRMYGGESSGMLIESAENEGTTITLWLPEKTEK